MVIQDDMDKCLLNAHFQTSNFLQLQEILIEIGSVSCVVVWSSQCLAFICYYKW